MELHALQTGRKPRVVTAMTMLKQMLFRFDSHFRIDFIILISGKYRYQGNIGAALVLGGVDSTGPHLFTIHPHGSTDKLPYVTMGSGSLAAMAVFESGWKPDMEVSSVNSIYIPSHAHLLHLQREEALNLVKAAIAAGIFNDLGSGSNIDACIITSTHTEMLRNVEMPNERVQKERDYKFRRGTTAWKKEDIRKFVVDEQVTLIGGDEMDTS